MTIETIPTVTGTYPEKSWETTFFQTNREEERRLAAAALARDLLEDDHQDAHNITTLAQWLISTRTPQAEDTWQVKREDARNSSEEKEPSATPSKPAPS